MLIVEKDFLYGNVQESLLLLDPFWGVSVQTTKKITIWFFFRGFELKSWKICQLPDVFLLMALGLHEVCPLLLGIGVQDGLSNLSSAVRTTWGTVDCLASLEPEVIILLL
jgi:hypothetical protein